MTNRPSPELDAFEARVLAELTAVVSAQAALRMPDGLYTWCCSRG